MVAFKAHFDGKVLVPDQPVDLPRGQSLTVHVERLSGEASESDSPSLQWLAENSVRDADLPDDLSTNLDHYLYGTPKKTP